MCADKQNKIQKFFQSFHKIFVPQTFDRRNSDQNICVLDSPSSISSIMSSPVAGTSTKPSAPTRRSTSDNVGETITNEMDSTSSQDISTRPKIMTGRQHRSSGSKSPEKCPICLSIPEDRSYTDSCFHEFCYVCLLEWSKVKSECPLCKQKFKNIIHNIRSISDYDKYTIPEATESFGIDDAGRRFRFPTTMTVERVELLRLIRQLHLQLEEMQRSNQIIQQDRARYMRQLARVRRLRHLFERSSERRERLTATSDFRRLVYERRLRAIPSAPGESTRRCSPEFFNRNPACMNRLLPWLNRELNVLLHGELGRVRFLMDLIRNMLIRYRIESEEARRFLQPYIGQFTDAFLHEFQNFARSSYDMEEYDRHVQYESWRDVRARQRGPNEAPPEIVIGSSPSPDRQRNDVDVLGSPGIAESAHNPSPPPFLSWPPATRQRSFVDGDAPVALLNRCQELLESNLMLLDSHRNMEHMRMRQALARHSFGGPVLLGNRSWNRTVELLSSSSEDDDSPRLDPNARTPPYLLRPRKRIGESFSSTNGKRRRFLPYENATDAQSSTLANGGASSSIIVDDDEEEAAYNRGTQHLYQNSVMPFSPAPRIIDSIIVDSDVDDRSDSDISSRQVSTGLAASSLEGTTPVVSSPTVHRSPLRSPISSDRWSIDSDHGISPESDHGISPKSITDSDDYTPQPSYRWESPPLSPRSWSRHSNYSSPPLWNTIDISGRESSRSRTLSPINPDEVQIVAELKPKYMRTPQLVTLKDDDEDVEYKPSVAQLNAVDDGPSTSGTSRRSRSRSRSSKRRHKHRKHRHHRGHSRHREHKRSKEKSSRHRREEEDRERRRKSRSRRDDDEDRHRDRRKERERRHSGRHQSV